MPKSPADAVARDRTTALEAVERLATTADPEAFDALLTLSAVVGEALGRSARLLAETTSWAAVGDASGTSRQAAWARWHG
mgnify:CR=1 FL=1